MANQDIGKSMGNRACGWVQARLPLLVGSRHDDQTEGDGEACDLTTEDRRQIERHVGGCTSCRRHRAALEQALSALATAAAHMPVETNAPSLWPVLECRIAHHDARTRSRWLRAARGLTDRWVRARAILHEEQALRMAWMRDTLGEALAGRKEQDSKSRRRTGLVLGYSVVAAVFVALIGLPVLRRQWVDAQSTIVANGAPLADPVVPPQPIDESPPGVENLDDDGEFPASYLVEADPVRAAETPRSGPDGTLAPKQAPHVRFGYDLEHGTPMPLDTRESKPVY
jgi:hypothetical protein